MRWPPCPHRQRTPTAPHATQASAARWRSSPSTDLPSRARSTATCARGWSARAPSTRRRRAACTRRRRRCGGSWSLGGRRATKRSRDTSVLGRTHPLRCRSGTTCVWKAGGGARLGWCSQPSFLQLVRMRQSVADGGAAQAGAGKAPPKVPSAYPPALNPPSPWGDRRLPPVRPHPPRAGQASARPAPVHPLRTFVVVIVGGGCGRGRGGRRGRHGVRLRRGWGG